MEGLTDAILLRLKNAGVTAAEAFPGGMMPKLTAPVAAVSLAELRAADGGFGRALGEAQGRLVEAVAMVRIFSPDGRGAAKACRALMEWGAVRRVELDEPVFDSDADCFMTALRAHITGLLADSVPTQEDGPAFTDFKLEGEMK